jgi:hypothetical protein
MTTPPAISNAINTIRNELANSRLSIIVGTGVTAAATAGSPLANWTGLIDNGINLIESSGRRPTDWTDRARADLTSGYAEDLIIAAEKVTGALGGVDNPTYRTWLRDTAGSLKIVDPAVPDALARLGNAGALISTTNYDDILTEATGWHPVTWRDSPAVTSVARGEEVGIIHLHGHWRDPASVVFGSTTYAQVMGDEPAMQFLRTTVYAKTVVFVGVGAGAGDPNFTALRRWMRRVTAGAPQEHYHLAVAAEVPNLHYEADERITPISYGPSYNDLAGFLDQLASAGGASRGLRALIVPGAPDQAPRTQREEAVVLPLRRNPPSQDQLDRFAELATRLATVRELAEHPDEQVAVRDAGTGIRLAQYRAFVSRFTAELDEVAGAYTAMALADRDSLERANSWAAQLNSILDATLDPA